MYKTFLKRVLDFFVAIAMLLLTSPLLLICMLAIPLDSKGPVFFHQKRIGKDNKEFTIYKLRTMDLEPFDKEGNRRKDRERLTKAGRIIRKFSLDELPQLLNIIKGEMSFIGPRPLVVRYLPHYNETEIRRHDVLPGVTGLAQVKGRSNLAWEKRFAYDVYYVDHLSFALDVDICLQTIKKVISGSDTGADEKPASLIDFDKHRKNEIYR